MLVEKKSRKIITMIKRKEKEKEKKKQATNARRNTDTSFVRFTNVQASSCSENRGNRISVSIATHDIQPQEKGEEKKKEVFAPFYSMTSDPLSFCGSK